MNAGVYVDDLPDATSAPGDATPTYQKLLAPFTHAINTVSRAGQTALQIAASFLPPYILGEAITGRDVFNHKVPAWQQALDILGTLLPFMGEVGPAIKEAGPVEKALAGVFERHPPESFRCQQAAKEALAILKKVDPEAEIIRVKDASGVHHFFTRETKLEGDAIEMGTHFSKTGWHEYVRANGRHYDALTGAAGETPERYPLLWDSVHQIIKDTRPKR